MTFIPSTPNETQKNLNNINNSITLDLSDKTIKELQENTTYLSNAELKNRNEDDNTNGSINNENNDNNNDIVENNVRNINDNNINNYKISRKRKLFIILAINIIFFIIFLELSFMNNCFDGGNNAYYFYYYSNKNGYYDNTVYVKSQNNKFLVNVFYMLIIMTFQLLYGKYADRFNPKLVLWLLLYCSILLE